MTHVKMDKRKVKKYIKKSLEIITDGQGNYNFTSIVGTKYEELISNLFGFIVFRTIKEVQYNVKHYLNIRKD